VTKCFKLLLLAALPLFFADSSFAQGALTTNIAWRYTPAGAFPAGGATVTICSATATGVPCTPTVSIFSDAAISLPVANPLAVCTASPQFGCIDGLGNFSFYALPGAYTYTITGAGLTPYGPIPIQAGLVINQTITQSAHCSQPTPSTNWVCPDNFNDPDTIVQAKDLTGTIIYPGPVVVGPNSVTLPFATPQAGSATLLHAGTIAIATNQPNAVLQNPVGPQTIGGPSLTITAPFTSGLLNGACYVDGNRYTTVMGAYNDTANCKSIVVPALNGACYSETVSSNWNINRAGVPIAFLGCANVTFGIHTISIPQGTAGTALVGVIPTEFGTGVVFSYSGSGSFFTVGSSAGSTISQTIRNIRFDLTAASNTAVAIDTKYASMCHYTGLDVVGNSGASTTQIAYRFDGTGTGGSSCTSTEPLVLHANNVNIGVQLTGSGLNAGNNNIIYFSSEGLNGSNSYCVDIEQGSAQSQIYLANCNASVTPVNIGGTATSNYVWSQSQNFTGNAVNFGASTVQNLVTGTVTPFSDLGTDNLVVPPGTVPRIFQFSCTGTASSSATLFLSGGPCTSTASITVPAPRGVWRNLRCNAGTGGVNASSGVVTVRQAGADSPLTASFGTGTVANDLNSAHAQFNITGTSMAIKVTTQSTEKLADIMCSVQVD
jgi:hypothetical protein